MSRHLSRCSFEAMSSSGRRFVGGQHTAKGLRNRKPLPSHLAPLVVKNTTQPALRTGKTPKKSKKKQGKQESFSANPSADVRLIQKDLLKNIVGEDDIKLQNWFEAVGDVNENVEQMCKRSPNIQTIRSKPLVQRKKMGQESKSQGKRQVVRYRRGRPVPASSKRQKQKVFGWVDGIFQEITEIHSEQDEVSRMFSLGRENFTQQNLISNEKKPKDFSTLQTREHQDSEFFRNNINSTFEEEEYKDFLELIESFLEDNDDENANSKKIPATNLAKFKNRQFENRNIKSNTQNTPMNKGTEIYTNCNFNQTMNNEPSKAGSENEVDKRKDDGKDISETHPVEASVKTAPIVQDYIKTKEILEASIRSLTTKTNTRSSFDNKIKYGIPQRDIRNKYKKSIRTAMLYDRARQRREILSQNKTCQEPMKSKGNNTHDFNSHDRAGNFSMQRKRLPFYENSLITRPSFFLESQLYSDVCRHASISIRAKSLDVANEKDQLQTLCFIGDAIVCLPYQFPVRYCPYSTLRIQWRLPRHGPSPSFQVAFILLNRVASLLCMVRLSVNSACAVFADVTGAERAMAYMNPMGGPRLLIGDWWHPRCRGSSFRSALLDQPGGIDAKEWVQEQLGSNDRNQLLRSRQTMPSNLVIHGKGCLSWK